MDYTYDEIMHQVKHDDDHCVYETMFSHVFGNKLVIGRNGNTVAFTVVDVITNKMYVVATVTLDKEVFSL